MADGAGRAHRDTPNRTGTARFERATLGVKVRCSSIELRAFRVSIRTADENPPRTSERLIGSGCTWAYAWNSDLALIIEQSNSVSRFLRWVRLIELRVAQVQYDVWAEVRSAYCCTCCWMKAIIVCQRVLVNCPDYLTPVDTSKIVSFVRNSEESRIAPRLSPVAGRSNAEDDIDYQLRQQVHGPTCRQRLHFLDSRQVQFHADGFL